MAYAFNDDKSKAKIGLVQKTITLPSSGVYTVPVSIPSSLGFDISNTHVLSFGVNRLDNGVPAARQYNLFDGASYYINAQLNEIRLRIPDVGSHGEQQYLVSFVLFEMD